MQTDFLIDCIFKIYKIIPNEVTNRNHYLQSRRGGIQGFYLIT